METRLLRMFCAVAEQGSLVGAAGRLHLTPSAISHGLKALEEEAGCRLFERAGKRVWLNEAGERLLAQARPVLSALEALGESMQRLAATGPSRLRVGTAASACQHLLPGVIRELKKTYPRLALQVESGDMPEMVELIRAHRVDLALGVAPTDANGLVMHPVFQDELMWVFAPSHPWAAGRPIGKEELRQQPLILYQRFSFTARLIDEHFRTFHFSPSAVMEVDSIEGIKELVKLNLGVSILAPWTADKELARGALRMRPLASQPVARRWVVIALAGRELSGAEETFCRCCRRQAAALRLDRQDLTREHER